MRNFKIASYVMAFSFIFVNGFCANSATLYGGVNHSDFLAPVDPVQAPQQQTAVPDQGSPQSVNPTLGGSARATMQNPAIEWFPIPKWLAGQWTKKGDITKSVTDLRTGITSPVNEYIEDHMTVTWGYQSDSQGNIWHAHLIPSERDGMSQGKSVSFLIVNLKVLEATPQNLETKTHYIVRESVGRQVSDIFQQESLTHYALVGSNDRMDAISSNRVFTYQGRPQRDGQMVSEYQRASNFQPVPSKQGVDLAASLNAYLKTHNMAGLAKQVGGVSPTGSPTGIGNSFGGNGIPTESTSSRFSNRDGNTNTNTNTNSNSNGGGTANSGGNQFSNDPLQKIDPNNPF